MQTNNVTNANQCLADKVLRLRAIQAAGGLETVCKVRRTDDRYPPWDFMPSDGRRLNIPKSVTLPATNVDTTILTYVVPVGYDGIIAQAVFQFTGQGFQQGSGDLIFRVAINDYYAYTYGNMSVSFGSLQNPNPAVEGGGIRIISGQVIQLIVRRPNAGLDPLTPSTAQVIGAVTGWIYPVR